MYETLLIAFSVRRFQKTLDKEFIWLGPGPGQHIVQPMPRLAHPAADTRGPPTRMVMRQLAGPGARDQRGLAAMRWAPGGWFLPPQLARDAYSAGPLPLGSGQTLSQPPALPPLTPG